MEWTSEAKQTLHGYIENTSGKDPRSEIYQDLFTDLSAHIEEELHQKGVREISAEDLKPVLTSIGADEFHMNDEDVNLIAQPSKNLTLDSAKGGCIVSCAWLFTIVIPIIALLVELQSHESKSSFLDPIPTWFHVVLIAIVPATFYLIQRFITNPERYADGDARKLKIPKIAALSLGFILPTVTYYALLFLPVLPISVIACIFLVGFLPLAPIFCLIAWFPISSSLMETLKITRNNSARKWMKYGIISGLVCLVALETPSYMRQIAINNALSEDTETQRSGIKNIRRFGGEDQLLYYCYYGNHTSRGAVGNTGHNPANWVWNLCKSNQECSPQQARELYYRVTGMPFNTVKPPSSRIDLFDDNWTWNPDNDHGGDAVAGRTRGLNLHSSRMDLHLDDESKLGYIEWIIEFKNNNPIDKEARMQMALPHQGFVSKLSLWVNGEERPAAYSTVNKVKAAYKEIAVRQRLDPVLVNVSGADRAMLQCFPVPANGGIMKMKVGITFPIQHSRVNSGHVDLPYIAERNFNITKGLEHAIYVQSDLEISAENAIKQRAENITTLQSSLSYAALRTERINWLDHTESSQPIWTKDVFHDSDNKVYLVREAVQAAEVREQAVIVVIDGSAPMNKWKPILEEVISNKQKNIQFFLAGSGKNPLIPCSTTEEFSALQFTGGIDNVSALRKALAMARSSKEMPTSILWIHGAQPVKFSSLSGLEQDIERALTTVPIHSVALEDGENHILRAFKTSPDFYGASRVKNAADLLQVVDKIQRPQSKMTFTWKRSETPPMEGIKVWDQLARKWAYDETISLWRKKSQKLEENAAKLAAHYQLVTPVSGAVVLESKEQYLQTGLEPPSSVNAASIPASPEPSTTLLMFLGAIYTTMRRKRSDLTVR